MQDLHDQINDYQSQLDKGLEFQELMKKANAIVKKHEAKKLERGLANKELVAIGLTYTQAEQVLTPDFMGRKGFPQYKLTNNNANNKRLKDRIEQIKTKLQGAKAVKNTGQAEEYVFDGGTIEVNYEIDRVQILFPGGRVDKELFKKLRSNGYVYSPTNQAFQRKITPQAIRNAIHLFDAKKVTAEEIDKGIEVETEHKDTLEKVASGEISVEQAPEEIAKDHLVENADYYKKLEEVEGKKVQLPQSVWDVISQLNHVNSKVERADIWNENRSLNLPIIQKTLWQIALNKSYTEVFKTGKEKQISFSGFDLLRAIKSAYAEQDLEISDKNLKEETPETPKKETLGSWRDSWHITRQGTPYGIDRALLSLVKNGNNEEFIKDLERVMSNINYNTKEKFIEGINDEQTDILQKIYKKEKEVNDWVERGGPHLKKLPKYDEWQNDIKALKILENHLSVLDAIAEQYFDENEPKKETLGSVSGGAFEEYADIEDELINQLELQGKLTRSDAQSILEANEEFAQDQYGIGVNTPRIAEKILALGKKNEPKKAEPFFRETGSDGYDSLIHKSKKENGKYVLRNETPETHLNPNTPEEFDNDIDPDYDLEQGKKFKEVIKLDRPGFEKKFGIAVMGFDQLKLYITFKDKSTGELDLSRNARMGNYNPPAFDKLQDVQYWLHNAVQYIHDQPELIEKNLTTSNKEWTSHPKGYLKKGETPVLSYNDFIDSLSELDTDWKMFAFSKDTKDAYTRYFRKFLFSPEDMKSGKAREVTELGNNGGWTEQPKGYASVVVDVNSMATANEIDKRMFDLIIKPQSPLYKDDVKKYQVGDILVATKNIEKPNKFSIFYQKGERIKIHNISDLPYEITTYIVENMDYMSNNEKEFYNALPETYLNDNFENQQPMEITPTKTIENSHTPDRIENRLLNPKGIQTFLTNKYDNQYQLNKGIEEFMTNKGAEPTSYSADEKAFIKKYSGYGGLSKFGTAGKGAFFEYYTPTPVIRKMWALAYKYGYKGGSILESSVGTGEFLALAPTDASITAYEINPFSADICRILYPQAKVFTQPFEQNFIENNFTIKDRVIPIYDLCIGNCPYGSFEIVQSRYLSGMGELKHVQAKNYAEYFLRRSLDLLKPGGLLILIVGADVVNGGKLFLDSDISPVKEYLAEHSDLLDAYRLPDSVFERTQVTTEIVVIQKK